MAVARENFGLREAEPILVLTRLEGASFVLDLTCDRLALHVPAAPSTTCVITCVPYAVTCERLSMTQHDSARVPLRGFIPHLRDSLRHIR